MSREIKRLTKDNKLTTSTEGWAGEDLYKLSCLMRIADATEAIASNYNNMKEAKEYYERLYWLEKGAKEKAQASNASLRGVITRMKNKEKKNNGSTEVPE